MRRASAADHVAVGDDLVARLEQDEVADGTDLHRRGVRGRVRRGRPAPAARRAPRAARARASPGSPGRSRSPRSRRRCRERARRRPRRARRVTMPRTPRTVFGSVKTLCADDARVRAARCRLRQRARARAGAARLLLREAVSSAVASACRHAGWAVRAGRTGRPPYRIQHRAAPRLPAPGGRTIASVEPAAIRSRVEEHVRRHELIPPGGDVDLPRLGRAGLDVPLARAHAARVPGLRRSTSTTACAATESEDDARFCAERPRRRGRGRAGRGPRRGRASRAPLRLRGRPPARDRPYRVRPGRDDPLPARLERAPDRHPSATGRRRRPAAALPLARGDRGILPRGGPPVRLRLHRTRTRSAA